MGSTAVAAIIVVMLTFAVLVVCLFVGANKRKDRWAEDDEEQMQVLKEKGNHEPGV